MREQREGLQPVGLQPVVPVWLVWLAAFAFVLGGIGSFGILDNNEGLYAEIPREMLASGNWRHWIIPHLNGLPYMEKPPLLYWLTAASFALFGQAEWAARLVPALSALACVGMLVAFGKRIGRAWAGRFAALMFITGTGVIAMSHVLMFDMLLAALLTAALIYAYRYVEDGRIQRLRRSYAFLALAMLAKGVVALVLFALVMLAFEAMRGGPVPRSLRSAGRWFDPGALSVFVLIAAPWHIVASLVEPVFGWFYFVNEHVLRFLGKREPHDYYSGGWWYYLPRMALYLCPWSFLVPALWPGWRIGTADSQPLRTFLLAAWLMPLLFFSASSAKANYYLVIVMPFAALHLAIALEDRAFLRPVARAVPGLAIAVLCSVLCAVLARRGVPGGHHFTIMGMEQASFAFAFLGGLAALGLASAVAAAHLQRVGVAAYLALPVWIAAGSFAILQAMQPFVSTRLVAEFIRQDLGARNVYLYRNFEELSSLPFYLKHPVPVVDARSSDLFWGNRLRRGNPIYVSAASLLAAPDRSPAAIVVMQRQLQDFAASGLPARFPRQKIIGETTVFYR